MQPLSPIAEPHLWQDMNHHHRYCHHPNVVMADVFNEPHGHSWEGWRKYVEAVGGHILQICPRWLIVAQVKLPPALAP